jgi:hypothetical protein
LNNEFSELSLTQHLFSKLFHDLSGALGAVSNGIEYLDSVDNKTREKAVKLLRHGSQQSIDALEFFRKAYGASTKNGEANLDEVHELCANFLKDSKINFDFSKPSYQPEVFTCVNTGRLILCLVSIAAEALVYGGLITVTFSKTNNKKKIIVTASSNTKIKIHKSKNQVLSQENTDMNDLTYENAHYYYTAKIIHEIGAKIVINSSDNTIEYIVE